MVNIPVFTRFYICQVVQDFFHQQYLRYLVQHFVCLGTCFGTSCQLSMISLTAVYTLCTAHSSWWVNNFLICQTIMHGDLFTDAVIASFLWFHSMRNQSLCFCSGYLFWNILSIVHDKPHGSVHSVHRPFIMVGEQFPHLPEHHAWGLIHRCCHCKFPVIPLYAKSITLFLFRVLVLEHLVHCPW